MNKKLFIFDLDGTLVNTVGGLNSSLNYAFKLNGFPIRNIEETAKAIGNGIAKTIERLVPSGVSEESLKQILLDFRSHYKDHYLDDSWPYEGMKETLLELKRRGIKLAVATNKLDNIAKEMINKLFPNTFDIIQGDSLEFAKKPNPEIINYIVGELGVAKEEVIYIGDSEVDLETATNAAVELVLCDYGFHRSDKFLEIEARHIKSPQELLDI